jgi:hypothetical protein
MQVRSKQLENIGGHNFLMRRLEPEVGSFIFMRLMGVQMRTAASASVEEKPVDPDQEVAKPTGAEMVRSLAFMVLSGGGVTFDEFKFVQRSCMECLGINVERGGQIFPMPLITADGKWTPEGRVAADEGLLMKLMMEVLVFCFADFFDGSGHGLQT